MNELEATYLLCRPDTALTIGTILQLSPSIVPLDILARTTVLANTTPERADRVLFAYRIPYLPDLLVSSNAVGQTEKERLSEVMDGHARLVANLAKWRGMAFSLRYIWQPERGEVEIALVGRGVAPANKGDYFGRKLAADVAVLLQSLDYPVEPVTSHSDLARLLAPITNDYIVEIRQHEEVASMILGGAYVVYPFRPAPTTWIPTFKMLAAQPEPCVINIHIEPTDLYPFEPQLFAEAAQVAETLADYNVERLTYQGRISDPVARVVARLYSDYLHRLTSAPPCVMTVQVASPDPIVARNIAQALANEMTETHSFAQAAQGNAPLPSGFDLVMPQTQADLELARQTLTILDLHPWGTSEASPGKERLRYLVDPRTASAAFRFPVPIRGGVPGIRTRQLAPTYDVGTRVHQIGADELLVGVFGDRGGLATVGLSQLTRHALIAGFTGTGKTTTSMHLLSQLWEKGVPFLVIEPAKQEYRNLLYAPLGKDLRVFTLGDEGVSPFRLNPLEILPGVRVETHISHLRACFEAALPTFGILPSLIEESLYNVYLEKGWELANRGRADDSRLMPTLGELYFEIIRATEERGYSDKTLQDIRAAAAGRIGSLLRGSKGRMLNTSRSIPMEALMSRPTVLELEALNDEEKALVMLFLLTMIREHCRVTRSEARLQHVTLIEEAHRVMGATPRATDRETSADTRSEAVAMFSTTLSEVRAYGEGLIIAEQIPGRLAEDALKNTNVKIVHRLPGRDDRQTIGGTMNLSTEQEDYLIKLPPGQAAFFIEGYERPTFVTVPNYKQQQNIPERTLDERVETHMALFHEEQRKFLLPFGGCRFCLRVCRYRDRVAPVAYELESGKRFRRALRTFEKLHRQGDTAGGWGELVKASREAVTLIGLGRDEHAAYCYFTHLWGHAFTREMADHFREAAERGEE